MIKYKVEIIDKFLNQDDFDSLIEISKKLLNKGEFSVFHNSIDKNNNIIESSIDDELLKKLHANYFLKGKDILKKHCPEKIDLIDYCDFTIIKTKKNSNFPAHDDTPNKLLSGVIYLYPENNLGTFFYNNKNGPSLMEIDWKPNRAVFFSRREKETWHSYKGDGKNDRIAFVFNLMTHDKNLKQVYKIEKKNYFFGKLRYKINPHLFRYFKFTI